uniref:Uncharacterized protein n=1 Tax=Romanomermis culicivorax TaxID=13658 RepID=A0A915JDY5_ROMCU
MISSRWPGFGALGYSDPVRRPYSERFYHWVIDTVSVKRPFFEKSRFLAYLRWSILIFFIWSVYYTLKNLYHAFVATVDRRRNWRKMPVKNLTVDGEELVDALEVGNLKIFQKFD